MIYTHFVPRVILRLYLAVFSTRERPLRPLETFLQYLASEEEANTDTLPDAIFYIYFQSYPLIFTDIYHFNAGLTGLTFLPIGVGAGAYLSCLYIYFYLS